MDVCIEFMLIRHFKLVFIMNKPGVTFKKNYIRSSSDGFLYLTILPTEQCNFRCVYCYEDFSIGKMSEDTVEGVKNLLTKAAPTLKNLRIDWFGGEPTLNKKAVIGISKHIKSLQEQYGFGYLALMTTNAYLLNFELFKTFVSLGIVDYQISLDGDKDSHDTTRVLMNGKGSFDLIWDNLKSYKALESLFCVTLRLHVTALNSESMLRLCDKIKQEFSDDKRFVIDVQQVKNLGGDGAAALVPEDALKRGDVLREVLEGAVEERKVKDHGDAANPYICYAAMPRQLMIRANGTIGKCTVMLQDDRNNLGQLNRDGTYSLDGQKLEIWTRGFLSLDKQDIICPAKQLPKLQPVVEKFNRDIKVVEVA